MKKIEILETKLQTLLCDDNFLITKESLKKRLEEELGKIIKRIAEYSEAIDMIAHIEIASSNKLPGISEEQSEILIKKCQNIIEMLEEELLPHKNKFYDVIEEIFTNQDLYDAIKSEIPSACELVDSLALENSNSALDEFLNWIYEEIDYIKLEDINGINAYQFIDKECHDYNKYFEPDIEIRLVKNNTESANKE